MSSYVDGFVIPIKKAKLNVYRELAAKAGAVYLEHGALEVVECVSDDVQPGKLTSFPQAVQLEDDEIVAFSWIVYSSRQERDRINKLVMEDVRLKEMMDDMPVDGKRMIWGGFTKLVELPEQPR